VDEDVRFWGVSFVAVSFGANRVFDVFLLFVFLVLPLGK